MSSEALAQFANQKYLSLESYRKSGVAVAVPVWFAEDDGRLYIYSLADAGKVKRIRNNARVRIAPCDVRGRVIGDWVDARARIVEGSEAAHGMDLLTRKYGLVKKVFDLLHKLRRGKRAVIAIEPDGEK
ncbi:MAG TPA: PPOX class F420-dependent oxidoreductase [Blastocatellia bacterium]|nr:PPOX class F420-dependent oxidoreductase [Blastocatellia bacterium]